MRRVLLPLLAAFVLWRAIPVAANDELQQGVTMTVYPEVILASGPWQTPPESEPCFSGVVPNIDFDWGGAPAADGCPADFFMVHFTGWLTVPESGDWEWLNWSDDGWRMTIGGVVAIDDWNFHGCGGHWSGPNEGFTPMVAGESQALDVWVFEWGGAACARLWYGSPTGYGVVPTEWLSTQPVTAPDPSPEATPLPSVQPSEEVPTLEPTPPPDPTPIDSPQPSPSPDFSPEPSPTPSPVEPSPSPATPSPTPTPPPAPETPTPSPSVAETPTPEPSPEVSPELSIEPSAEPTATPEPTPTPEMFDPGAAAEEVAAVIGEAAAAVSEAVTQAAAFVANLGHDLTPAEKEKAAATIVPAVIVTQVAQAAAAAAAAASSIGGSRKAKP